MHTNISATSSDDSRFKQPAANSNQIGSFWRFAPWLSRLFLLWPTVVLTLIGFRGLLGPVQFGASEGISFQSPEGVAIARVAFGAFPLGCALFGWWCIVSRRRIGTGLTFIAMLMGVAIAVRIVGVEVDHALGRNVMLIWAELVITVLCLLGIFLERRLSSFRESLIG